MKAFASLSVFLGLVTIGWCSSFIFVIINNILIFTSQLSPSPTRKSSPRGPLRASSQTEPTLSVPFPRTTLRVIPPLETRPEELHASNQMEPTSSVPFPRTIIPPLEKCPGELHASSQTEPMLSVPFPHNTGVILPLGTCPKELILARTPPHTPSLPTTTTKATPSISKWRRWRCSA